MKTLPSLIAHIAPIAERYLTLLGVHPNKRYSYAKRGYFDWPVIEVNQHHRRKRQIPTAVPEQRPRPSSG